MTLLQKFYFFITLFLIIMIKKTFADTKSFIPHAPIINFKLPMFNKEGYQSWHIHGQKGIYVNEEQVDVIGMKLDIFSGNENNLLEATIESPKATIFLYENQAKSKNKINVIGNGYTLSGKNWFWNGKLKKIIINQNVKIVFNESLTNLFTYEK